ncbi:hypothetical protein QAD02_021962 [Eretmocerus hayati]|uniref:Uncharacterized protein n=1 Tax=Eretmocerus hayati TaxID=131215 RepID=A0ACC2PRQ6_9HYME|nr:hypothetical protein QAD02_021962 [Eretmocerus hayati]
MVMSSSYKGSRNLGQDSHEDFDFYYGRGFDDPFDEDFVPSSRQFKERAAAAFEEDMADLRRKRKDMQERLFDMIDLNAEIEKAKNTLGQADSIFQRHALRFDNEADDLDPKMSLARRLDRARQIAAQEVPDQRQSGVKWTKLVPVEQGNEPMPIPSQPQQRRTRLNSLADDPYADNPEPRRKRGYNNRRKKSVSF